MFDLSYEELLKEQKISDSIFHNYNNINVFPKYKIVYNHSYVLENLFNSCYRVFDIKNDQIFDIYYDKNNNIAGTIEYKLENGSFIVYQIENNEKYNEYFKKYLYEQFGNKKSLYFDKFTYLLYNNPDQFFEQFYINKSGFEDYIICNINKYYIWIYYEKDYIIFPKFNKKIVKKVGKIKNFDYIENI